MVKTDYFAFSIYLFEYVFITFYFQHMQREIIFRDTFGTYDVFRERINMLDFLLQVNFWNMMAYCESYLTIE